MDAQVRLQSYSAVIDARLSDLLQFDPSVPAELREAMRYAVLGPGKRVRPALCMASAYAAGGRKECALDAGCAIEFVHCFSLIHDDLPAIDDDDMRRGRPTVHMQFGEATAILAGDALFALAFEVLSESATGLPRGLEAVRILAKASGPQGLVGGEIADVLAEGQEIGEDEVCSIHRRKTGALIEATCRIGALWGSSDEATVERLGEYGAHAGLAFQISDDLLNELSTATALGKSVGSDRARSKATYPAAFGLEESKAIAEAEVEMALQSLSWFDERADDLRVFARYVVDRLH